MHAGESQARGMTIFPGAATADSEQTISSAGQGR